jgi:iron-sulfur cluster assembly accessory protein
MSERAGTKTVLTPAAEKFIRRMLRFSVGTEAGFRFKVRPGGCSGFAVEFDVVAEPAPNEIVWEHAGLRIFLDGESSLLLDGATLNFQESLAHTGFVVANPNQSARACGQAPAFVSVEALQKR